MTPREQNHCKRMVMFRWMPPHPTSYCLTRVGGWGAEFAIDNTTSRLNLHKIVLELRVVKDYLSPESGYRLNAWGVDGLDHIHDRHPAPPVAVIS